ncbi:MAG: hypothetical protein Q6363_006110 [Candidatus Njordarchaeota archaeon]
MALKYVVIINKTPIPIVRKKTEEKIAKKSATFRDIKEEIKFVIENLNEILTQEQVLEIIKYFSEVFDLREYVLSLRNILGILNRGESGGSTEVSVIFEPTKERLNLSKAYEIPISSVAELDARNTTKGIVYVYTLGVAETGRVGEIRYI